MSGLTIESDGELLRLTLARPEKHNALDGALIAALTRAFAGAAEARAVVLRGAGAIVLGRGRHRGDAGRERP